MRDRPTADLIMVFLAGIAGSTIFLTVVAVLILEIHEPKIDTSAIVSRLTGIVNSLIGAIVGYVAGRGANTDHT